jgi:hypothetical protein
MKVLEMIEEGKISVEDGAKLLATLEEKQKPRKPPRSTIPRDPRSLRVRVNDARTGKLRANVVLPMGLVDAGLSIAANFADGIIDKEHSTQLADAIRAGRTGKIIEVIDGDDGEHVEIFIE